MHPRAWRNHWKELTQPHSLKVEPLLTAFPTILATKTVIKIILEALTNWHTRI